MGGLTVFARGALLGARGNSGVILSQLMRAGADQLLRGDPTKPGQLLADTLTLAADAKNLVAADSDGFGHGGIRASRVHLRVVYDHVDRTVQAARFGLTGTGVDSAVGRTSFNPCAAA